MRKIKQRPYSLFDDCFVMPVEGLPTPRMQVEAVYQSKKAAERDEVPIALYLVCDGERVAYRGQDERGAAAWIPTGNSVTNIKDDYFPVAEGPETLQ
jgi:hypothetical protein